MAAHLSGAWGGPQPTSGLTSLPTKASRWTANAFNNAVAGNVVIVQAAPVATDPGQIWVLDWLSVTFIQTGAVFGPVAITVTSGGTTICVFYGSVPAGAGNSYNLFLGPELAIPGILLTDLTITAFAVPAGVYCALNAGGYRTSDAP